MICHRVAVPCDLSDSRTHIVEIAYESNPDASDDLQVRQVRAECGAEGDAVMRLGGLSCRGVVAQIHDALAGKFNSTTAPVGLQAVIDKISPERAVATAIWKKTSQIREDRRRRPRYVRTVADEAIASLVEKRLERGPIFVGSQNLLGQGRIDVILWTPPVHSHYAILWNRPSPNPMLPSLQSGVADFKLEAVIRTLPGAVMYRATRSDLAGSSGRAGTVDLPAEADARLRNIVGDATLHWCEPSRRRRLLKRRNANASASA